MSEKTESSSPSAEKPPTNSRRKLLGGALAVIGLPVVARFLGNLAGHGNLPPPTEQPKKPELEKTRKQAFQEFIGVLKREYKTDKNTSLWSHLESLVEDSRLETFFVGYNDGRSFNYHLGFGGTNNENPQENLEDMKWTRGVGPDGKIKQDFMGVCINSNGIIDYQTPFSGRLRLDHIPDEELKAFPEQIWTNPPPPDQWNRSRYWPRDHPNTVRFQAITDGPDGQREFIIANNGLASVKIEYK